MATVTPMILVEHLTKAVGDKTLFHDVSFAVNEGERIALVARNGIGKSTLMDILHGHQDYNQGSITLRNGIHVGYLPQDASRVAIDDSGSNMTPEYLLLRKQLREQLHVPKDIAPAQMSGGQRKRLAIAEVLAAEPDLLLMDEPTNHLDLETIAWLEEYLSRQHSLSLLLVTHDRWFLDRVCSTIIELDKTGIYTYRGHYADYLEQRSARIQQQNAEADKYRNLYRTELDWMRRMPQARGHKAQYRIDNFYEIERKAKSTIQERDLRLAIQSGYIGNKIFEARGVSFAYEGTKTILKDFSYIFARKEKLGIIGKNGTGKSTFLRLLLGELMPDAGCFDIGTTVRFGYYAQTGLAFEAGKKVIDIARDIAETVDLGDGQRLTASQFLQHFLFSPDQQYNYVDKLSGGERQRLHLCTVLMRSPNFLILDEPTNDLDIPTLNVLEEYLRAFKGCVIVVSHDRYFMDKVVDHLFVFHGDGVVRDFPGNYTQYREQEQLAQQQERAEQANQKVEQNNRRVERPVDSAKPRRLTFAEKRELAELEQRLPELETRKAELETLLSGGLSDAEAITRASQEYEQVRAELDEKEMRWLELNDG